MYGFVKLTENGQDVFRLANVMKTDGRFPYVYTYDGYHFTSCQNDPIQTGTFYNENGCVWDLNASVRVGAYGYPVKPTIGICQYCGCRTVGVGVKSHFVCNECRVTRDDIMNNSDGGLRSYSYKPQPMFNDLNHRKTHLHMGFELEFDQEWFENHNTTPPRDEEDDPYEETEGSLCADEAADSVCYALNKDEPVVYCKGDGSLTNGVEIVSLPMTYDKLAEKREDFKSLFRNLLDEGWRSEAGGRCGFHIHCDKEFLGDDPNYKVAKLALLFARWDKELTSISRRHNFNYCQKNIKADEPFSSMVGKVVNCEDRYVAINNQNSGTVEIRLWRGTLNIDTFYATLDLTQALVTMAKKFSVNTLQKLSFESVYKFMKDEANIAKIKQLVAKKDIENENDDEEE